MTSPTKLPALALPVLLIACSIHAAPPAQSLQAPVATATSGLQHEAILLVSLEDGTVIKQTISVDADICLKQSTSSSTLCFSQGDAIFDAATNTLIGFEMIEERIDLVAKAD